MSKDPDKKVENSFQQEDGKDGKTQGKLKTSFATKGDLPPEQQEQKPQPTQLEVSLYIAKRLNDINDNLGILIEQGRIQLQPKVETKKEPAKVAVPEPITPQTESEPAMAQAEDIKMMFPEDLEALLFFEEKEDYVLIKPRQFLGSENFTKIASVVRGIGGDYVSAGKESHFRCPKNIKIASQPAAPALKPQKETKPTVNSVLVTLKAELKTYIEDGELAIDETSSATMYIVKILKYLGKPKFTKIAGILKPLGAVYVSQGKASHFDVPKSP